MRLTFNLISQTGYRQGSKTLTHCVFFEELQHSMMTNRSESGDPGQLYDNPYEERTRHHHRAPPAQQQTQKVEVGLGLVDSRESRLPQDDERPADEYDQPWEWKKDNISKALAGKLAFMVFFVSLQMCLLTNFLCQPAVSLSLAIVQFEGAERERSRAQTEQTRLTKTGTTSTTADATTLRLVGDTPPLLGERVDPSLPLERQV